MFVLKIFFVNFSFVFNHSGEELEKRGSVCAPGPFFHSLLAPFDTLYLKCNLLDTENYLPYYLQKKIIYLFIWFILYIHTLSIHFITKQNLLFDAYTNNTYTYIHNFVVIMSTFQNQGQISWSHGYP